MTKINKKVIICIIGLAIIGLASIVVDTKFYIYIGAFILFFFFILAIFLNREKIKKYISKNLTIILEDEARFYHYFKKRFPMSYKYLPFVKIVSLLLLLTAIGVDSQTYSKFFLAIPREESLIPADTVFYSQYAFCLYLSIIVYEYVLSIYITLKANHPVRNAAYQIAKHTARAVGASSALAVGYSNAPVEPNFVSNFVHTKTYFGRGWDYEIGSLNLKAKGDVISGALGREDMVSAVEKHASDSRIVDINRLNNIIADSEYNSKIRANTTIGEKVFLGIPLVDFTNNEGSAIPNSQDKFSETSDDSVESTDKSTTFDIKKTFVKRHKSEPLPRRTNKPVITRRNTR